MKKEAYGDYFVLDHSIRPTSESSLLNDLPGSSIYEVVKVKHGVPVFFEDHMKRFRKSADLSGVEIYKKESEIHEEIKWLIEKNRCDHINVKLMWMRRDGNDGFAAFFIPLEFAEQNVFSEGARAILFPGERIAPNIKTLKGSFRDRVQNARTASKAYEALLVDGDGFITEGSRSNVFFLEESGVLATPPITRVLAGVTRSKVMEICRNFRFPVEEKLIHQQALAGLHGAFITGTTVDVTPLGAVGKIKLDSAAVTIIRKIVSAYERQVDEYIAERAG